MICNCHDNIACLSVCLSVTLCTEASWYIRSKKSEQVNRKCQQQQQQQEQEQIVPVSGVVVPLLLVVVVLLLQHPGSQWAQVSWRGWMWRLNWWLATFSSSPWYNTWTSLTVLAFIHTHTHIYTAVPLGIGGWVEPDWDSPHHNHNQQHQRLKVVYSC